MITTKELVHSYALGGSYEGSASGGRLYIVNDRLYNYSTCIADRSNGTLIVNVTKYSPTTSKHQNYLIRKLKEHNRPYVTVNDQRRGVGRLTN